ncbi:MAG: acyl-CoA dehydrogenase [Acidobacteriota bacterium]
MAPRLATLLDRFGLTPRISDTERAALEAGDVWIDGDFFSGAPDLAALLRLAYPQLSEAEQAFLDGPVEEVCQALDIERQSRTRELGPKVWELLRTHRFFGLGIAPEFGGHGFSALAQSAIFGKLGSHSMPLSSIVLIPNSVGPAELLAEVGTDAQKAWYLPRLARGDEIPCFALTEPDAGSDAASMRSHGRVVRRDDGSLGLRLTWEKRYITLAPIATLIGLAFRLEDPDGLLGGKADVGITCALVPADADGVEIGRYHDPMGVPFPNGPIRGRDVEVSIDQIIGGPRQAGRGWTMLMEALSGGRAISLPAQATAGVKHAARVAGAYARVRRQFDTSIGRFEGVQEPLARLGGTAYQLEAARVLMCGAIDSGRRPAVLSAALKYTATELGRARALDVMDVLGGAGLSRGPRNLVADGYIAAPIGVTVEGANILTRSLIVFGQGAIRSHPHAQRLLEAMRAGDAVGLCRALVAQARGLATNVGRAFVLSLSRGRAARTPIDGPIAPYARRLVWASALFALWTDLALVANGPSLKRRGKLSGRFADILAWMVLTLATLRRFEAEGRRTEDLPLMQWAAEEGLWRIQQGFEGLLANFEAPLLGPVARGPLLTLARLSPVGRPPSDRLGGRVAALVQKPGQQRDRLTAGLAILNETPLARLDDALRATVTAEPAEAILRRAMRAGRLTVDGSASLAAEGERRGLLTTEQRRAVERAAAARREATRVDDFSLDELRGPIDRDFALASDAAGAANALDLDQPSLEPPSLDRPAADA